MNPVANLSGGGILHALLGLLGGAPATPNPAVAAGRRRVVAAEDRSPLVREAGREVADSSMRRLSLTHREAPTGGPHDAATALSLTRREVRAGHAYVAIRRLSLTWCESLDGPERRDLRPIESRLI